MEVQVAKLAERMSQLRPTVDTHDSSSVRAVQGLALKTRV